MPDISRLSQALADRFTIDRELGGGGMSRVFLARETALDRQVVIKVLPAELMAGVSVERFRREIQLAARLQQANIVPVLSAGDIDGAPYYTMPFVIGDSLRARMSQSGTIPVPEVISILRDIARALAAAHTLGIVHRDIKPENVLLSGGAAVVTDFGIAKAISSARGRDDTTDRASTGTLTEVGMSLGTPAYMAPEQAAGDPSTDRRADIYAFGVIAYELLAGRSLFDGRSAHELVAAHMGQAPVAIATRRADTPPALAVLVMQCLAKDPNERPQSASDLLSVLDNASNAAGAKNPARALAYYGVAFAAVALIAHFAITGIGLPEWVFPAALAVMALGLPATLLLAPRRALRSGVMALGALVFAIVVYMGMRALGIGPVGSLFAQGTLKESDEVVVTDFRTVNADSTFGRMMAEAVRTGLSQSSAITVAPSADITDALKTMRHDLTLPLDLKTASEVALRLGAKAVVDGDISGVGSGYLVSLRLVTADGGAELASFHAAADSPKALIEVADGLVRKLRAKAGESLRSVNSTPELFWQTTSSLDALQSFTLGIRAAREGKLEKTAGYYRDAVRLDSNFAMAWSNLGATLSLLGMTAASDSANLRAYGMRDRLTEWERLSITARYYGFPYQRDPLKASAAYQQLVDRGDSGVLGSLATLMLNRRDYAHAEPLMRAQIRKTPKGSAFIRLNFAAVLFNEGKVQEAEAQVDSSRMLAPSGALLPRWNLELAYQRGELDVATRIADSMRTSGTPAQHVWGALRLADFALLRGQATLYERYQREASAAEAARGNANAPIADTITFAYRDVWMSAAPARRLAALDAALARVPLGTASAAPADYFLAATTYAIGGRADRAKSVLAQYDAAFKDTIQRRLDDPDRHYVLGEIALAEKRWRDGIAEIRRSDSTVAGDPSGTCRTCVYARLGRAFDRAGMPDSAAAMYEQFLQSKLLMRGASDRTGTGSDAYWMAPISKRLGELYEQKGDHDKAVANYSRFVELWKNADPEYQPLVVAVRNRLAELKKVEGRK